MCLTSHTAYCVLALGPQWQFQFKFSPLCLSSVFWQPASGFSPASLPSFIPLKLPPSSSQRVEWRTLYMWSKMGPSGGVKYSQRVPASNTKKKKLHVQFGVAAGGIFLSSEKNENTKTDVSWFFLFLPFLFLFPSGLAVRCVLSPSWLLRDLRASSADVSDGRSRVRIRRLRGRRVLAAEGELG